MNTVTKTAAAAALGGSLLVMGSFGLANAAPGAPPQPQAQSVVGDGKVNVALSVNGQQLGIIQDVSLTNAESLATAVCPSDDLSTKLPQLDNNEIQSVPVCASSTGALSYTFTQNGPGNSDIAPAQSGHGAAGIGSPSTTTTPAPPSPAEGR
jgi:hypothetical protein